MNAFRFVIMLLYPIWKTISMIADGITRNGREVSPVDEDR